MIQQKKKKIGKYGLSVVVSASVLLLLIIGYAVIDALIGAGVFGSTEGGSSTSQPTVILDGESTFNGRAVAYPYIAKSSILSVSVRSHKDAFRMERFYDSSKSEYDGYFTLLYEKDGTLKTYYPSILSEEPDTDYTDFYAIEGSDGLNAFKIDYLCAAIGALYFGDRIELSEDSEERIKQINRYGLGDELGEAETIYVDSLGEDGKKKSYKISIGDKLITGTGYYYRVYDQTEGGSYVGRDYVYTTLSNSGFDYLLGDFEDFLHSRLVAEGLDADSLYEPYLTTDYKQWTNTYYDKDGTPVVKDSEVVIEADLITPKYKSDGNSNIGNGYDKTGYKVDLIDLKFISGRPEFARLISMIEGAAVGKYDKEMVATIVTDINEAKLGSVYKYYITGIESVLTDTEEYEDAGYSVGDNNLVKVTYTATVDGEEISDELCHAVINLSRDTTMPEDVKAAIRASKVGDTLNLSYEVTYTEENSVARNMEFVITEINIITSIDENGKVSYTDTIVEDSIVTYSYKWLVDGYEIGMEGRTTVDFGAVTEGDDLTVKNALLGKGIETDMSLKAFSDVRYCQHYADFITYRIRDIIGFVEKELIVSFRFANGSERDPFYGESIYKNTLENENKFFSLNSSSCQNVTYLFGGIGSSSNSQQSAGLVGTRTVAVGLTPEVMNEYGLYDGYTVYYELPRGISISGSDESSGLDDFKYLSTLGFTLYISKPTSDGTRYIASTMYDIVAQINGAQFDYLEKSFDEYWARKNLVMIDYKLIDKVDIEIGTNDIYGKYSFNVDHKTIYIVGNEHYDTKPEQGGTEYDELSITVTPEGDISETVFSQILEREGRDSLSLANLYDRVAGQLTAIGHDTAGAANYKEFLSLIYGIYYVGVMDDADSEAAFESPKIFSLAFTLSSSAYSYVYDFYRVSDRRVMVHIYRRDASGNAILGTGEEVSGFYISTFAAKKMINAVTSMLNGENIDVDDAYWSKIDGN